MKRKKSMGKIRAKVFQVFTFFVFLLVMLATAGFVIWLGNNFTSQSPDILNLWIGAIALAATFALLSFEYAKTLTKESEDARRATDAGKKFFSATVFFVFGSILISTARYLKSTGAWPEQVIIFLALIGFICFLLAAGYFAVALLAVLKALAPWKSEE